MLRFLGVVAALDNAYRTMAPMPLVHVSGPSWVYDTRAARRWCYIIRVTASFDRCVVLLDTTVHRCSARVRDGALIPFELRLRLLA